MGRARKDNPRRANGTLRTAHMTRMLRMEDTCWLCGGHVDAALRGARAVNPRTGRLALHPMAPVLDEFVPVARGGDPLDFGNLRLAHCWCNGYRGARMDIERVRREIADIVARRDRPRPTPSQEW